MCVGWGKIVNFQSLRKARRNWPKIPNPMCAGSSGSVDDNMQWLNKFRIEMTKLSWI